MWCHGAMTECNGLTGDQNKAEKNRDSEATVCSVQKEWKKYEISETDFPSALLFMAGLWSAEEHWVKVCVFVRIQKNTINISY